jgi:DNA-binding transcriptional LysR family regulator
VIKEHNMELRLLRYFVAVAEELHFRRAAERLYVAQPAVSEQIRKLEAELGVRLFDRTNRRVAITEAGAALLEEGRRVLAQAETAQLAARNARERAGAWLRIGYLPDSLPASVPRALGHVARDAPRVEVSLETGSAVRLIQRVRDHELDAVVTGLPAPTSGLIVTSLGHQSMVVAIAATDGRAVAPAVSLARLAPTRLVTMSRDVNPAFHDAVVALCRDAAVTPRLFEVPEPRVESVLLAVAAGAGPALLPAAATERYAIPGVRFVPLEDGDSAFESAVLTHPDTDNDATAAFLRALARFTAPAAREPEAVASRPALRLAA